MPWKYGMLLVSREGDEYKTKLEDGSKETRPAEEDCYLLVELYSNPNGEYHSYCDANMNSPEALTMAHKDVQNEGINTWFYENGEFIYCPYAKLGFPNWDYEPCADSDPLSGHLSRMMDSIDISNREGIPIDEFEQLLADVESDDEDASAKAIARLENLAKDKKD
jgi:hypothetical protein